MLIKGRCHCGNIAFALTWEPDPASIPARACSCSFCVKHGGVWTSDPDGALTVRVRDAALVTRYAFGTKTAEFHVCARCGVVPVVTSRIDGRLYAVVNVNAFEAVEASLLQRVPASFEGEGEGPRLERRQRNWIATVEYLVGDNDPGAVIRQLIAAINRCDWTAVAALLQPGFRRHSAAAGGAGVEDAAAFLRFLQQERAAFPDAHEDILDLFSDGSKIAARHSFSGTQLGALGARAPTGKRVQSVYIALYEVQDGRIARCWAEWDNLADLAQLGSTPGAA